MNRVRATATASIAAFLVACSLGDRVTETAPPRATPPSSMSAERRGIAVLRDAVAPCEGCDPYRSLVVTDKNILDAFSFREVMEQIACPPDLPCTEGQRAERGRALFQRWWATQGEEPLCNSSLFGFPYDCRRAEGNQALVDPFKTDKHGYRPIGLFNRIDLTDPEGRDCGEYRIVFAKNRDPDASDQRLYVNFEAVLPNPDPDAKLAGCRPIAEFWRSLSDSKLTLADRVTKLRRFYIDGLPELRGVPPAIHADNLGARECRRDVEVCPTGQIRTNQRMELPWLLREFRTTRVRAGSQPVVRIRPATVKDNAFGRFFGNAPHPKVEMFRDWFVRAAPTLAGQGLNELCFGREDGEPNVCGHTPDLYNTGQSRVVQEGNSNYVKEFSDAPTGFVESLTKALDGTGVTPTQAVARAQVLSCAGCHHLSNDRPELGGFRWPCKSERFDFVHIVDEIAGDGRYPISEVLRDVFIPHRLDRLGYVIQQRDTEGPAGPVPRSNYQAPPPS